MAEYFNPIELLTMAEAIRRRPAMYLGDLGVVGLHRLVCELIEYSLAECSAGKCNWIAVRINNDGSLTVDDNGRGIPVTTHANTGMTTLEWVMRFSTSVKCQGDSRNFRPSLHGVGIRTVIALSDWAEAEVSCDGRLYKQRYDYGNSVGDVCDIGPADGKAGTTITFHPDAEIFKDATFDWEMLAERLRELAFLEKGLTTQLSDERQGKEDTFHYPEGIADLVECLNKGTEALHQPLRAEKTVGDVQVEFALQFTTGRQQQIRCYADYAYNRGGGTHQQGFQTALTQTINGFANDTCFVSTDRSCFVKGLCAGFAAIVTVKLPEPQFESQTKIRLNNPEVESIVASVVEEELTKFLTENPEVAHRIF